MNQHDEQRLDGACISPDSCNDESPAGASRCGVACAQAKSVALRVLGEESLAGKVFLMGGLVPWIVSGLDSGRQHGDVDLAARAKDMPAVRVWLAGREPRATVLDSLDLPCNVAHADYGLCAIIDGVSVSFCPFTIDDGALCQRSAAFTQLEGFDALFEACASGIAMEDFVERRVLPNGGAVGMATLETCRAAKVSSDREKDAVDIAELDRLGYDSARLARMTTAFERMNVICVAHSA